MPDKLFNKILIANRSEIAVRVINACRSLDIPTLAIYSDADLTARHRFEADESVHIGESLPSESYLNIEKIIKVAKEYGCDAIHPGYGFLAENASFSKACRDDKITFIGPSPESIELMGNKVASRVKMVDANVPLIPGMKSSESSLEKFKESADKVGYPVLIKAAAGGGGKGMRIVNEPKELPDAIDAAQREAKNAFGDDTIYLEKYIEDPRHIEFQVLADLHGNYVHLFERECSIQRRHQKIIEETPSVALDDQLRQKMGETAIAVAKAANYHSAGTVEFLLDKDKNYYFLEMNTRIQVEHPITEMVCNVDLVVEQIRIAAGQKISDHFYRLQQNGHAIEARIYAEDGENNFFPSTGKILFYKEPTGPGVRVDSGIYQDSEITIDYDPIMAKLIVHAPDRNSAIANIKRALNDYHILGVKTSKKFMIECLEHEEFINGNTYTNFIENNMQIRKNSSDVITINALAACGAASLNKVSSKSISSDDKPDSPWDTIGHWQIGDSISNA